MELIVISNPSCFIHEPALINQLFESGMHIFHLRKDGIDLGAYRNLIEAIHPDYHDRLVLHQFHELAGYYGIHRLHYKENHRNKEETDQAKTLGNTLSSSIHDLYNPIDIQLFDYVFYGPVFDSFSKPGYRGITVQDFMLPNPPAAPKIIAIGGVDAARIRQIEQMGFDGAAVLGALWNEPGNTIKNFKKIQQQCQQTGPM